MKKRNIIITVILVIVLIVAIVLGVFLYNRNNEKQGNKNDEKIQVISSNFASYDFLRAIIGDSENIELNFLLGPGKDAHSFDPAPQDLVQIQESDLFIYIGGEMEKWADAVVENLEAEDTKIICISDYVEKEEEQEIEGAEDHHHHDDDEHDHEEHEDHEEHDEHEDEHVEGAFDEHIWTSPENAIRMVEKLAEEVSKLDEENSSKYEENAEKYIKEIEEVDKKIQEIVSKKKRSRLVFADKMPMQYFINYYDLDVSAAFSGCSTEVEPGAKTIAFLVEKVKEEDIPVVLYIEMGNEKLAKTVAEEAGNGAKPMQIQTLHNVTKDDFEKGETWVSLMERNLDILKSALQ